MVATGVARPGTVAPAEASPLDGPPVEPDGHGWQWRFPVGVLLGYLALAVLVWGRVWIGGHPAGTATCACGDPAQTIWSLRWVPFALGHGLNPFFSGYLFAPHGVNLLDNTSSLLPSFVLAPVTVLFGPVASLNVAVTAAPALNAWCAYAALRPFTTRRAPAFAGGLLYGFSPFVLTATFVGHLQFAVLVFPPLLFIVLHETVVRRRWSTRRSATTLAVLLVGQFLIGTEMLALTLLAAVIGLGILAVANRSTARSAFDHAWRPIGYGVGAALVVLAYPIWFLTDGPRHFTGVQHPGIGKAGITMLSIVDPGQASKPTAFGIFVGYSGAQGPSPLYLGVAMVVLLVVGTVVLRRLPAVRWAAVMVVVTTLLAGGAVYGDDLVAAPSWFAPWRIVDRFPLLGEAGPSHLAGVTMLVVAVLFTVVLDRATGAASRWVLERRVTPGAWTPPPWSAPAAVAVVALVALVPIAGSLGLPAVVEPVVPAPGLAPVVAATPEGSTMLLYPFPSALNAQPLVWQAQSDMAFKMVGGYGFAPGPGGTKLNAANIFTGYGTLASVDVGPDPLPLADQLTLARTQIDGAGITVTSVLPVGTPAQYSYALAFYTALLGRAPAYDPGGAWVWRGPADADPPLETSVVALRLCAALGATPADPSAVPDCVLKVAGAG